MGLNTAMIVRNDFLHEIENDPEFGKKVALAISYAHHPEHYYHGQAFDVLPSSHADYVQVVAISGNRLKRLGYGGGCRNDGEAILRELAAGMGFRLVRKPGRK